MRIKKLILTNKDLKDFGLKKVNSAKLGQIVALVGKNGSGKTRYLKAIEKKLLNVGPIDIFDDIFDFLPPQLNSHKKNFQNKKEAIEKYLRLKELQEEQKKHPNDNNIKQQLNVVRQEFNHQNTRTQINANQIEQIAKSIQQEVFKRIKVIKPSDLRALKANFDSKDKSIVSFQSIIDSTSENIEINEFSMISTSALTYLQRLPHKLAFDDIDTRGDEKKFKNRVSYKRYSILRELVQEFLGKQLDWKSRASNVDEHDDHISIKTTGYWTIDGREFNYNDFSDGEKVLFTYALLLFLLNTNPRVKFKDSIIIIDEPELNLHPKAQIKLIDSLQKLIKETGQLIIATHSLSIVANLEYGSINLIRESEFFTPSSSVPFDSIDDLMGFNEHYNKIVEFLVSTPSWAMTNFMAQCFDAPEVFESASKNDPQIEIFKNLIQKESIRILDFGSGKGRLLDNLVENKNIWSRIKEYDCFDIEDSYNELLKKKGASAIINNLENIGDERYDVIIMVNVLHEIHIKEWTKSLNKLKKALTEKGFLAVVEDIELPIGELPNENGFILLDKKEFKTLLGDKTSFITSNINRYKDRIICSLVQKNEMNRIDKNKLIETLETLKSSSLKSIIDYRKKTTNEMKLGRLYALKANLYLNSDLSLDYIRNN